MSLGRSEEWEREGEEGKGEREKVRGEGVPKRRRE